MTATFPRLIHRLWLGPLPMPERFKDFGARWRELNPGWQLREWSWHNLPCYWDGVPSAAANQDVTDDLLARATRPSPELAAQLADVLSYHFLLDRGGIYVNCDICPVRPLSVLPHECWTRPWASMEDQTLVSNAVMAGQPGDRFWEQLLEELPRRYFRNPRAPMYDSTGPHLLTEMWQRSRGTPYELLVLPRETFNPIHLSEVPERGVPIWAFDSLPATTVAVHTWDHRRTGRKNLVP